MASAAEQPVEEAESREDGKPTFDAKAFLERTLPRQPGDVLKVFPMHRRGAFRVNWYHRQKSRGTLLGASIACIRESKFLFCRLNAEGAPEITYPAKQ